MKIRCPKCGREIVVNDIGRKPLAIPFKNICDSLWTHCSVELAAENLGCSRGYIYQELKKKGLKPKDVILSKT